MKVALCFFGQPRYLENKNSFTSHKEKIYSQCDVDVFTHFWFSEDNNLSPKSDWCTAINPTIDKNAIEIITQLYSPKQMEYEKQIMFYPDAELQKIVTGKHSFTLNNTFCLMSHLYSMQRTIEMLEKYIINTGTKYDFLVMSRYDNKILDFPNLNELPREKFFLTSLWGRYPAFTDHLFISDLKYTKAFKMFDRIKQLSKQVVGCCPEEYKLNQVLNIFGKEILIYLEKLNVKFMRSSVDN